MVAAGLGAAALLTLYYVLGARGVANRDTLSLTWWAFAVAALAGALTRPWWTFPYRILAGTWPLVLYLVLAGSIASYLLVAAAMRHLPPASVGIIGMVEPVIASAVAWLVLDERIDAAQLTGGALIIIGVGLAETARTVGPSTADTGLTTADEPHPEGRTRCIPT